MATDRAALPLLGVSAILALAGHVVFVLLYFVAPTAGAAPLEEWFIRHFPTYHDCFVIGGFAVVFLWMLGVALAERVQYRPPAVFLWMLGVALLAGQAWSGRRPTLRQGAWALATPLICLVLGLALQATMRHIPPLSIRW